MGLAMSDENKPVGSDYGCGTMIATVLAFIGGALRSILPGSKK